MVHKRFHSIVTAGVLLCSTGALVADTTRSEKKEKKCPLRGVYSWLCEHKKEVALGGGVITLATLAYLYREKLIGKKELEKAVEQITQNTDAATAVTTDAASTAADAAKQEAKGIVAWIKKQATTAKDGFVNTGKSVKNNAVKAKDFALDIVGQGPKAAEKAKEKLAAARAEEVKSLIAEVIKTPEFAALTEAQKQAVVDVAAQQVQLIAHAGTEATAQVQATAVHEVERIIAAGQGIAADTAHVIKAVAEKAVSEGKNTLNALLGHAHRAE